MQTATFERIFGGIMYLLGAFSKYDLFSHLQAFLDELYGTLGFSIIAIGKRPGTLVLEFSTLPGLSPAGDPEPVVCPDLLEFLELWREGGDPAEAPVSEHSFGGLRFPLARVRELRIGGRLFGWIVFHEPARFQVAEEDSLGLEEFAFEQIAFAYYRVDDSERLQALLDLSDAKLSAINRMGEFLSILDLDVLLTKLLELSLFMASAQVGSVVLQGEGGIESRVEWGISLEMLERLRFRGGKSILSTVLETGRPELISDFRDPERFEGVEDFRVDAYLCIPLVTKDKLLGAINLINSASASGFTDNDRESILTISSLASTTIENAILHRAYLEKERITENLRIAQSIQNRFYPKECPWMPGYEMAWSNSSCEETGGDYFDFIPIDDGSLATVIGDISGHGIGAALLMATGRASLRALLSVNRGMREAVEALDAVMERDMDSEKFMTLFVGKIDPLRHELTYVNAGHDRPLFYHAAVGTVEVLDSTGLPLGILGAGAEHPEVGPLGILPGDALLLSTDGVWEALSPSGEMFGKKRLTEIFLRTVGEGAERTVRTVEEAFAAFTEGAPKRDDFTLVVIKRVS